MMKQLKSIMTITMLLSFAVMAMAQDSVTLRIGDPAPAFKTPTWFKGDPIDQFQKGHIYLLDFWATWCGPCRRAFPHLNEIAHAYKGKVTVIAVNVREGGHEKDKSPEFLHKRSADFVASMGDKMDFLVCADTPEESLLANWMKAAGMLGIPTTIIVDQQGRIAWIGHPAPTQGKNPIDKALDELLAGTYDYKKAAAGFVSDSEEQQIQKAIGPVFMALKAKDYKAALAKADEFIAANPGKEDKVLAARIVALCHTDEKAGLEAANKSLAAMDLQNLFTLSSMLAEEENLSKDLYELAIRGAEKILASDPSVWFAMIPMAQSYFRLGNTAKAIELQQKVVNAAKSPDSHTPPEEIAELENMLKKYLAEKK